MERSLDLLQNFERVIAAADLLSSEEGFASVDYNAQKGQWQWHTYLHDDEANQQTHRRAHQATRKLAKQATANCPFVRISFAAGPKQLNNLERVKGIEPSYSAWKSRKTVVFSTAILTFSVFLAH
jgi:hypothetical protein